MPWTAIAGGLIAGIAGSAMSSATSYMMSERAQERSENAYKHRHQWAVEDLRKAGLNPVLSAGGAAGQTPTASAAQAGDFDLSGAVGKASAAQLNREMIKTQETTQMQQAAAATSAMEQARVTAAEAQIAEQKAQVYRDQPQLAHIAAYKDAGMNPSSAIGAASAAAHVSSEAIRRGFNSARDAVRGGAWSRQKVLNGGPIIKTRNK